VLTVSVWNIWNLSTSYWQLWVKCEMWSCEISTRQADLHRFNRPWIAGWWRVLASSQARRPSNARQHDENRKWKKWCFNMMKLHRQTAKWRNDKSLKRILRSDLAFPRCKTTRRPEISLSGTCNGVTANGAYFPLQSFHEKWRKNADIESWQDQAREVAHGQNGEMPLRNSVFNFSNAADFRIYVHIHDITQHPRAIARNKP
jgi:hypothetical protein